MFDLEGLELVMNFSACRVFVSAAALCVSSMTMADWTETFDGSLDNAWLFVSDTPAALPASAGSSSGTAAGSFTYDTAGNILTIADADPTAFAPGFAGGQVGEIFTDVMVSGTVSAVDNDAGLLARADLTVGDAYIITVDFVNGIVDLSKAVGGAPVAVHSTTSQVFFTPGIVSAYLEFIVTGSTTVTLTGKIWETSAKTTFIGQVTTFDDTASPLFTSGASGVITAINGQGLATEVDATFDDVHSAVFIPEPASIVLAACGLLLAVGQRRRHA